MLEDNTTRAFRNFATHEEAQGIALMSAAISLKRIADAMTTGDKNDRIAATEVAKALGYKPGSAAHDITIRTIEVMSAKGFMVVES
jgi:hypothetical protein